MGYYVNTTGGEFVVPAENILAAYAAVCALNDHDELKWGGSYGGGGIDKSAPRPAGMDHHPARWFSWMPADYPNKCGTLCEVFQTLGFDVIEDAQELRVVSYDSKTGQEEIFLEAIAPFCTEDSFFEWRGEDGAQWRHTVRAGELLVWESEVVYHSPREVDYGVDA